MRSSSSLSASPAPPPSPAAAAAAAASGGRRVVSLPAALVAFSPWLNVGRYHNETENADDVGGEFVNNTASSSSSVSQENKQRKKGTSKSGSTEQQEQQEEATATYSDILSEGMLSEMSFELAKTSNGAMAQSEQRSSSSPSWHHPSNELCPPSEKLMTTTDSLLPHLNDEAWPPTLLMFGGSEILAQDSRALAKSLLSALPSTPEPSIEAPSSSSKLVARSPPPPPRSPPSA
mmetsp:Transcript_46279/g.91458  ORF Transcript_46279/g.91458 Transcript_46279/m.91458 type:complete len:233 (-) Transcript_46279:499-1197(-)